MISLHDAYVYEVRSSWWTKFVWWDWGQTLASKYFVWKTKRKWNRYLYWTEFKKLTDGVASEGKAGAK